jgi:hypothetical protein
MNRHGGNVIIQAPTARAAASAPAPEVIVTLPPPDRGRALDLGRLLLVGLIVRLAGDVIEAAARHLLNLTRRVSASPRSGGAARSSSLP